MFKEKIINILSLMTNDFNKNIKVLREEIDKINYLDDNNQSLLHIFLSEKHDENKMILAIKTLVEYGNIDLNLKDNEGYNFIQTAIESGYSENFILELLQKCLSSNRKLDVNTTDCNGNTIVHTAINSKNFTDEVINIYVLLQNNGFNSYKKNMYNENLVDSIKNEKNNKYTNEQVQKFIKIFNYKTDSFYNMDSDCFDDIILYEDMNNFFEKDLKEIDGIGKVLNLKKFNTYPTIGMDNELEKVIITLASYEESPLIIGESGVGKTALVNELVYRIINEEVPNFLKNKIIVEVNPSELIAGTMYVGTFGEKVKKLMNFCKKHNAILFIDDIYRIYGTGSHSKSNVDFASMLKSYLDQENNEIKMIGTTTIDKYNDFFTTSSLKDKFEVIKVSEPDNVTLYRIIEKIILDYDVKSNIVSYNILENSNIIDIIIEITSKKKMYNDKVNNPKLAISIVDKAFAYARVEEAKELTIDHFIKSIDSQERIYPSIKEKAIQKLVNLNENNLVSSKTKVLKVDFKNRIIYK